VPFPGSKDFKQTIHGGFTFNVFDSPGGQRVLKVVANTYTMRATNDFTPYGAPVASDLLSVEFNTLLDRKLQPLLVNDATYPNSMRPTISLPVSWDWTTFTDPDEPKLHGDLPLTIFPFQGTIQAQGVASFAIQSISRLPDLPGDYNLDAQFDNDDHFEWRKAFGTTFPYADGNRDGIVDAGDYVEWRAALSRAASSANLTAVPEPAICPFIFALVFFFAFQRRRLSCD
jgi:hypothetical protein